MATTIDKDVLRRCPDITSPDGRALDARLHDADGGSITLKWVGLKSSHEHTFALRELIDYAENPGTPAGAPEPDEEPVKKGKTGPGFITFNDLLSRLHIVPMDLKDRERLVATVTDMKDHQDWLAAGNDGKSWESFKTSQAKARREREGGDA